MLRHIVLMQMGAETDAERAADVARLCDALLALPAHISQIRELSVGTNVVERPGNWDLALTVDLDDAVALEEYRGHPEHVKVLQLIEQIVADRCAVDFTV
jgi:Stress responsive A/B Barrel Domain